MKNLIHRNALSSTIGVLLLLLAVLAAPFSRAQQATPTPPNQMSYQGLLTDANGAPLGQGAPTNYNVFFRIYNGSTGSTNAALWGELQTVTVDKGYFSVVLGQGSPISGTVFSSLNGGLASAFTNVDASVRYIGMTVQGLNPSGGDTEIQPRLRLLPSGYAFLAANANSLISSTTGSPLVTTLASTVGINQAVTPGSTDALDVTGNVTIRGSLTANLSASQLVTGTVPTAAFAAGSVPATALPNNLQNLNNNNGSALTSLNASQITTGTIPAAQLPVAITQAVCPAGSVMAFMGTAIPQGWLLCNGATVSRTTYGALFAAIGTSSGTGDGSTTFTLPDLRGVFLRGVNGARPTGSGDPDNSFRASVAGGNSGNNVGSYQPDTFLEHQHIVPYGENTGSVNFLYGSTGGNTQQGSSGTDHDNSWPFTSGAVNSSGNSNGGKETRPRNVYVNYIIKY